MNQTSVSRIETIKVAIFLVTWLIFKSDKYVKGYSNKNQVFNMEEN